MRGFLERLRARDKKTVIATTTAVIAVVGAAAILFVPTVQPSTTTSHEATKSKSNLISRILHKDEKRQKAGEDKTAGSQASNDKPKTRKKTEDTAQHQPDKLSQAEQRLKNDVANGLLTEEQAKLIAAKLEEAKQFYADIANRPQQEQRNLVRQKNQEFRAWATQNNIRPSYVRL